MKAGVAAMLFATDELCRRGFPGRIVLGALVDEEGMMLGAKDFVARGRHVGVDAAICCEPEAGEICHVAKGALRLRIDFTGKMAHGAMPFQGRNPNRAVGAAIGALADLEARLQAIHGEHPHLGLTWVTPTVLRAGDAPQMNVMPAAASMWIDVRTIPSVDHDELVAELSVVGGRRQRDPRHHHRARRHRRPAAGGDPRGRAAGAGDLGRPRRRRRFAAAARVGCRARPTAPC